MWIRGKKELLQKIMTGIDIPKYKYKIILLLRHPKAIVAIYYCKNMILNSVLNRIIVVILIIIIIIRVL